ncbi:MAG TPA: hypothetical protein DEB40_03510 [Elusimicrobia bacterium]|nr:hypothetical protein [Elusimicrobiota bacterium]HBT60796.1 hypothetical protein [Elusimicrobiota bacterium]
MGKQWVRQQIKKNEIQDAVDRILRWVASNRRTAGIAAAAAAGVILLGGLSIYSYRARQSAAWDQFSLANAYAYQGQTDEALKKVEGLNAQYPSAAATGYALLFAGELLYQKERFPESAKYYKQLLDRGQPQTLLPFALEGLGMAQEAMAQCAEASQTGERFLQTYPDHFLAPQAHASLARCQITMSQAAAAKATLQKMVIQYPETSWASWAQEKLKTLGT